MTKTNLSFEAWFEIFAVVHQDETGEELSAVDQEKEYIRKSFYDTGWCASKAAMFCAEDFDDLQGDE